MQRALRWAFAGLVALSLAACGTVLALGEPDDGGAGDGGAREGSAGDGGAGEGGPDIDGGCANGTTVCDGICVDTRTSPLHCGSCNSKCNRGPCLDGGCEKTVFITNAIFSGNMGGLLGADMACNQAAQTANLPGTYMAWLASETVAPADRFTKNAAGYLLVDGGVDGGRVATSWADLTDGQLLVPIDHTEKGYLAQEAVWSNVAPDGTRRAADQSCVNWTSEAGAPTIGGTGAGGDRGVGWTATAQPECAGTHNIYCFEQ